MKLQYSIQPPKSILDQKDYSSWEQYSLPLGNGYFGACVFGRTDKERIQLTENSVANPYNHFDKLCCGLQSFGDIFIDFDHKAASDYHRELSLDNSLFSCSYNFNNIAYERSCFTSYPDRILAYRIKANKDNSVSFTLRFSSSCDGIMKCDDGTVFGRTSNIEYKNDTVLITGKLSYYNIELAGVIKVVIRGGHLDTLRNCLEVLDADEAVIYFSCKTNYVLSENVFLEKDIKKKTNHDPNLLNDVKKIVDVAADKGYKNLYERHLKDYQSLYNRVSLYIGEESSEDTSTLLNDYKEGKKSLYLESLLFQFGRYLLISSSRKGALPANLQGVWNAYQSSPWSCGYWHNINLQMNYWGCWSANLAEMFESYSDYAKAYFPECHNLADKYIKELYPEKYKEHENGWIIGTGAWPYYVEPLSTMSHSGPGTGAFTSLLFWEHYAYTQDKEYLKNVTYPFLYDMSIFLEKCLIKDGDKYLVKYSASPENVENPEIWNSYHRTNGCAFDQQMVYENFKQTIFASEELGIKNDPFIERLEDIIDKLDNVLIGGSGQIKEYREENNYSDIGDPHHRHISQLVGLYPGTQITDLHPELIKAAEYTLNARGDKSTGWSTIHRLLAWARIKNCKRVDDLLSTFISNNIMDNLWDKHPPFQIDGNLGYVAGICEMLVQSQCGYIDLLPALPESWKDGYFKGIKARGNFEISCEFKNRKLVKATIISLSGNDIVLKNRDYCFTRDGQEYTSDREFISIKAKPNELIEIRGRL